MAEAKKWVVSETGNIFDDFKIGDQIGQPGQFGVAKRCQRKKDGEHFAVKVIDKQKFMWVDDIGDMMGDLRAEIEVMQSLSHNNIIKLHDVYETQFELYLVQELCTGGELFDEITKRGKYTEKDASLVVIQIFKGVAHMHQKGIAHCDLKPDNLLFHGDGDLKIIDFGMAKRIPRSRFLKRMCGTPYYTAPEIIKGQYHKSADCWAIGVIMFVMLYGYPPFYVDPKRYGKRENDMIYKQIRKGFVPKVKKGYGRHFPESIVTSDEGKDLIKHLLRKDVAARLTAVEAMDHKWFASASSDRQISAQVKASLETFRKANRFKTTILNMFKDIQIDAAKREKMQQEFNEMDKDKNGQICWDEFKFTVNKLGILNEAEARKVFDAADFNNDQTISFDELLLTVADHQLRNVDERLYKMFLRLDQNKDGFLSADEIKSYVNKELKDDPFVKDLGLVENMDSIIKEADVNKDGRISWKEFFHAIHPDHAEEEDEKEEGSASADADALFDRDDVKASG